MKFLLVYDLKSPNQNYDSLYRALACLSAVRISESCWTISRNNISAFFLKSYLTQYIDSNDILFIAQIKESSYKNIPIEAINLLNN